MEMRALPIVMITYALLANPAGASSGSLSQFGISAPLRVMATYPNPGSQAATPDMGVRPYHAASNYVAADREAGAGALPRLRYVATGGATRNFEGLRAAGGSVSGAAGDLQYVQAAGGQMAVYSKDTARLLASPAPINALFYDAPPGPAIRACRMQSVHDAAILYDHMANRWLVTFRASVSHSGISAYYQCLAVSASADATGSYYRYAIALTTPTGAPQYADDAKLAAWPDAYYVSFSLFDSASGQYAGPRICGVERRALLAGAAAAIRCADVGARVAPVAPAGMEGYGAPAGDSHAVFVSLASESHALLLWRFSWRAGLLGAPKVVPVAPFTPALAPIQQPDRGAPLAAMGDRIAPRVVYRHDEGRDMLLLNHTVQSRSGQASLRWYDIGDPLGTPYLVQQGALEDGQESRFMGSIGVDKAGNIVLGYSAAAADTPPGVRYTGREAGDSPGSMQAEEVLVNGTGVHSGTGMIARATGVMALDPIDGCTFWYTQRYVPLSGVDTWRTRIVSVRFRSCR